MGDWKFYTEIDFSDEKINQYHIDTRDFNCSTNNNKPPKERNIDFSKAIKEPERFCHTGEEILLLLNRLFTESGGKGKWRMLCLEGEGEHRTSNWQFKYIRIHRLEKGLVVCNSQHWVMNKEMLKSKVNQEYLHAH
jgi:hypothetical protein